jgi:crossover junction endodeoxyribonuclease RusA
MPTWDRDAPAFLGAFTFTFKRPLHHYVSGDPSRELRDRAPRLHVGRPDLDKILRSTWDALTASGVIYDDARISQTFATKVYVDPLGYQDLDRPGCKIALTAVRP